MKNHAHECAVPTNGHFDVVDVTPEVAGALDASGVRHGHVTVSVRGSGCALVVNEKETGLISDIREASARFGAGRAGLPVGSTSVMLPAIDGALALGTWQRVLLVELDSETSRTVVVQIVGE